MTYIGIDHSTTGVKVALIHDTGETETFTISRTPDDSGEWSFTKKLESRVDTDQIDLVANGYSYGDNFTSIKDISALDDRGVVDHMGAGHGFGTGTQVFDELRESDIPCVMFPGVHGDLDCLHPYFEHYSVYSGADTVAMTRYAKEQVEADRGPNPNFISACVSSSSMATMVHDGEIRGGFHWIGLIHGHVDVEMLRKIDAGDQDPSNVFMKSGLLYRSGKSFGQVKGVPDAELLENIYWSTLHIVYGLSPFTNFVDDSTLDDVVLSGRLSTVREPFDMKGQLEDALSDLAPVRFCEDFSTAIGAAYIAKDVCEGASDILGIPVGKVPVTEEVTTA